MNDEPAEEPAAAGPVEAVAPTEAEGPVEAKAPITPEGPIGAGVPVEPAPAPSTEIVLAGRRLEVAPGRWAQLVTGVRGRVVQLSRHPAAVASVSAATTIGGALLVNALRQAGRAVATRPPAGTGRPVVGYVLHEVHVFHHVVHHVVSPRESPTSGSGHRPRPPAR
jgi:hypothetical protein